MPNKIVLAFHLRQKDID